MTKPTAQPTAIRPDTDDSYIWSMVYGENLYGAPDTFHPSDIVLDVGSHIGAFSRLCLDRGAKVFGCEPSSKNIPLAILNTDHPRCVFFPVAVWGDAEHPNFLVYQDGNTKWSDATVLSNGVDEDLVEEYPGSVVALDQKGITRAEYIATTSLDRLITLIGGISPKIRLLKISTNGCEYPILFLSDLWVYCQTICVKVHDLNEEENNDTLRQHLVANGFCMVSSTQIQKGINVMKFERSK